jgi:hypothetical protein
MVSSQILVEPGLGKAPIAFHRLRGHADKLSNFFNIETPEEAKLDDTGLPRVKTCQAVHGIVNCEEFGRASFRKEKTFVEGNLLPTGAALNTKAGPRVVNQNVAHKISCNSEKMSFALPAHIFLYRQA